MSAAIPDLERMYECGDVLANAKGLSYKAVSEYVHSDSVSIFLCFSTSQSTRRY